MNVPMPYIKSIARRMPNYTMWDREDLEQELWLWFEQYGVDWERNGVKAYIRRVQRRMTGIACRKWPMTPNIIENCDVAHCDTPYAVAQKRLDAATMLAKIPKLRDRKIVWRTMRGEPSYQIGKRYAISGERARQIRAEAISRMKGKNA